MSKEIEEIEKRQKEIAELYVQLINTGELIKREIKYPLPKAVNTQILVERYCAIADGILSKMETIGKLKKTLRG